MERTLGNNMQVHFAEFPRRGSEIARRNNMEVQLAKLFMKKGLNLSNLEVVAISLATQGIGHDISLARGIRDIHVIIGYCLEPSLLTEVQVWLSIQILQTLVIRVYLATITQKVMSPQLQSIDNCC
jgi:hypothetical protein